MFQAPFRAGITIDAYQMEPLRKALRLPRVNLFIADDTGLGKTTHPAKDPLRIPIATDAAREGLNSQAHCSDLFHFDLPWNPGRIEQRNGRVNRKLQRQDEVCHYFGLPQRAEDRVLEVLVNKTGTIKKELGSLSQVIDDDVERRLKGGIRHQDADTLRLQLEGEDIDATKKLVTKAELEDTRDRQDALSRQIDQCRNLLDTSRRWVP